MPTARSCRATGICSWPARSPGCSTGRSRRVRRCLPTRDLAASGIRDRVRSMRWLFLFAALAAPLSAQLAAPNDSGVSLGHIHLMVADPEEQKKLWVGVLGAEVT